jgi:hypothetical protein
MPSPSYSHSTVNCVIVRGPAAQVLGRLLGTALAVVARCRRAVTFAYTLVTLSANRDVTPESCTAACAPGRPLDALQAANDYPA